MTPPSQLHRSAICHRHPTRRASGFCASCLRERLAGLDPDTHQELPSATLTLRRSKSCRGNSTLSTTTTTEPRRKSCDVRPRNNATLSELFIVDDDKPGGLHGNFDLTEVEEKEKEEEVRVFEEGFEEFENGVEVRPIREFIDLERQRKKSNVASGFLGAASVFSKKLRKWGKRERVKRAGGGVSGGEKPGESEVGEYRLGRRSCDVDPRLSVDAGRMSVDSGRCSFDEPRASWDGVLIGRSSYPRFSPMVAVAEDGINPLGLSRNASLMEGKMNLGNGGNVNLEVGEKNPGGVTQTRDYYGELMGLQRGRRSFERSCSNRRIGLVEVDELKSMANAKVSPETDGLFHGAKLLITEKDLRESNWYSLKEYRAKGVEAASNEVPSVDGLISQKGFKKAHKWGKVLNIWNLVQKKNERKCNDQGMHVDGNMVDLSLVEHGQQKPKGANVGAHGVVSQKLIRSYTLSSRNSCSLVGLSDSASGVEK